MFCTNCGTQIPEGENVKKCANCGMSFESTEKPVTPKPTQSTSAQLSTAMSFIVSTAMSFIDQAVANYVQSSLVLALVGFISTFMTWVSFARSELGRSAMSYFGINSKLNVFNFISIQDEPEASFLFLFVIPIIGLILAIISSENNNEKLGKSGVAVMGIGGVITYLIMMSYVSEVNEQTYSGFVNLGAGTKVWLVASILQIVLFILIKKKQTQ